MSKEENYEEFVVVGHFRDSATAINAVRALREKGVKEVTGYSPFPCHDFEDELYVGKRRSPVRMFTLLGGLAGCFGAFLMTTWMSIDYPIRTSAKQLISVPAFVVIAFECTILLGAIITLASMGHFSQVPNLKGLLGTEKGFNPKFTSGTFGLVVSSTKEGAPGLQETMESAGAKITEVEYVR